MSITLRGYQSDWIAGLRAAFASAFWSVLGVLPTGGGKTVCFSYLASRLVGAGKRVIIGAHRDELLDQISGTLLQFDVRHGRISAGMPYDRRLLAHVASVLTLIRRLDAIEVPDFLIIDEAHHATLASAWGTVIAYCRAKNPNFRVIGVTATPERLSGEGLGETFQEIVIGPSTGDLIESGDLSDYRLISPSGAGGHADDFDGCKMTGGDLNRGQVGAVLREKPQIVGDAVELYRQTCDGVPAIAFCVSIEETKRTADRFRADGYRAASIDGKMTGDERRRIVTDFRSGAVQVLTSADLVSEGFDLPGIVAAIMLRPTYSLGLYLQQVGRSLRKAPGKDHAIILDHVGNCGKQVNGEFVPKHGLPDDPREWTLEGRGGRKGKAQVSGARQCPKCYSVSRATSSECRECGTVFPIMSRTIEEVAGTMDEVDVVAIKRAAREEQGRSESLEDLLALAARTGKKPGWARHVWEARQKKAAQKSEDARRRAELDERQAEIWASRA